MQDSGATPTDAHQGARRHLRPGGWAAVLVPVVATAALILSAPMPVRAVRDITFDSYQRLSPRPYDPTPPVRIVDIDDDSLARLGQWPWPRARLAAIVDRLQAAGAAAVAFDILLSEPERTGGPEAPGDERLAEAVASAPVVMSLTLTNAPGETPLAPKAGFATAGDDPLNFVPRFPGVIPPLPLFTKPAAGLGALNWVPDRDLVVRRVPTLMALGDALVPSLASEALRVAQGASTILVRASNASGETAFGRQTGIAAVRIGDATIATEADGALRIHYAGTRPERRLAAWRLLDGSADTAALSGAIVLVGTSAAALADVRATPLEAAVPGVDIHAEFIEHVLSGARLMRPDYAPGIEVAALLTFSALAAALALRVRPLVSALGFLGLAATVAAASWLAFSRWAMLIDPVWPLAGTAASFATAIAIALRRTEAERRWIRQAFARYLSPEVVAALAREPGRLALGGEIRPITVLFADIRGFTSRAERLDAREVVTFLNTVHTPLTDEVMRHGGTIDKFLGDGLMAFWNAPLDVPDHVAKALKAALAMQAAIGRLAPTLAQEGLPPLAVGIGIHTGPACVGNLGSRHRFDYSAVGDTVNAAARIEQTSKVYGEPILVSGEVVAAAPAFTFVLVDEVRLRGRGEATRLYALVSGPDGKDAGFDDFRRQHDAAIAAAINGRTSAQELLEEVSRSPAGARHARLYAYHRTRLAENEPVPEG
ncbi:CHASE2 domain-containing protein [Chelatococcus sp. GW1]|uniref:CHASE2 domain-containing protein n=1 Tax=Chelatococcus sp. GW1 TaxID=1211115 RepID=UPI0002F48115|nr:adenylate/guanylate cyclase domain-containing protein [Chelatococcus sp. GW1]